MRGDAAAVARVGILLSDAQRLASLEGDLTAIASGNRQPSTPREALDFARLCRYRRQFAAAARCYELAVARDESRAEAHRYDAACTAALAAAEKSEEGNGLTESQRAAFRALALDWLTAELKRIAHKHSTGGSAGALAAVRTLRQWQIDPDLAGVRDASELARLAASESDQWRTLWSEVDQLVANSAQRE